MEGIGHHVPRVPDIGEEILDTGVGDIFNALLLICYCLGDFFFLISLKVLINSFLLTKAAAIITSTRP